MTWLGEQLGRIADEMPEHDLPGHDLYARAAETRRRRRRNLVASAAAAVAVVTMVAVTLVVRGLPGEPITAARPSGPPELPSLKIGVIPTVESAPVFLALREGYFQEEGLAVEPVIVTGAPAAVPPTENGALDLAYTDYSTLFMANERGKDFKIVSSLYRAAPGSFTISVDSRSRIRTVAGLKRKKVAVPNLAGLGSMALEAALKRAGLELKDVVMVEVPYPEMLHALRERKVDAALLAEPYVTVGRDRARVLADVMTREFRDLHTAGVAATTRWAEEHPRTLAAFRRALAKAQRLIADDPGQVREVLPRYTKVLPEQAAALTFGAYPAEIDLAELRRVADLARAHKLLRRPADPGRAVAR